LMEPGSTSPATRRSRRDGAARADYAPIAQEREPVERAFGGDATITGVTDSENTIVTR